MDFVARLRKAVEFYKFDKLRNSDDPTEEMVLVTLIAGLESLIVEEKILEKLQDNDAMSVTKMCTKFNSRRILSIIAPTHQTSVNRLMWTVIVISIFIK